MGNYLQMGHNSTNLLENQLCGSISGAVLSPVDIQQSKVKTLVSNTVSDIEFILDPQLYYPASDRRCLSSWSYFPKDVDTADLSSENWWMNVTKDVINVAKDIGVKTVASPAIMPRAFPDEYYFQVFNVAQKMFEQANGEVKVIPTVLVQMSDLTLESRVMNISTLVSSFDFDRVYIIFISNMEPRKETREYADVLGACKLIQLLKKNGISSLVGYSSSDMLLWKFAGADDCATGKFFNLRRFTSSRFAGSKGGGGMKPYFFEESLLAFLRGPDVLRLKTVGLKSSSSSKNPNTSIIEQALSEGSNKWVGNGWKQYLWWFHDASRRMDVDKNEINLILDNAKIAWGRVGTQGIRMDEVHNDGSWVTVWRQVIDAL